MHNNLAQTQNPNHNIGLSVQDPGVQMLELHNLVVLRMEHHGTAGMLQCLW